MTSVGGSLPKISKLKYLTSDDDNQKFREVYGKRVNKYEQEIEKMKARMKEITGQLKALESKEKEINSMTREEVENLQGDGGNSQPAPKPKQDSSKPKNDSTGNKGKDGDKGKPKDDGKSKGANPADDSKPKGGKTNDSPGVDPLANIHKPTLDPKMTMLLPLYKEKRKLKDEHHRLHELVSKLDNKKNYVVEKDKNLQVRENILKTIHITPEYLKERKNPDHKDKQKTLHSLIPLHKSATSLSRKPTEELEKLKHLKKGFYLDVLENTSQMKTVFNRYDRKYNLDHIIKIEKEHKEDQDLKFRKTFMKAKQIKALYDIEDPDNIKFLKETGYLNLGMGLGNSQVLTSSQAIPDDAKKDDGKAKDNKKDAGKGTDQKNDGKGSGGKQDSKPASDPKKDNQKKDDSKKADPKKDNKPKTDPKEPNTDKKKKPDDGDADNF